MPYNQPGGTHNSGYGSGGKSPSGSGSGGGGKKPKSKDTIVGGAPKASSPRNPFTGKELSPTAHKIMDKRDEARKRERDKARERKAPSTNPLDALLGYETEEDRIAAYQNNPNRPQYDTSTMGVPISEYGTTATDLMLGQNLGMNPAASAAIGGVTMAMPNPAIGMGLAATRAIQAITGMSGGPSVGGFSDGKLSKSQSRINADKSAEGYQEEIAKKRKKAAQATLLGATTEDNGLGLDKFGKQVQYLE